MQPFAADSLLILIPEQETCILKNQFHRKLFSAKCISHFSLYFFLFLSHWETHREQMKFILFFFEATKHKHTECFITSDRWEK